MVPNSLEDRMKMYYESVPDIHLVRRCPVIVRLDGRSFRTFTRGFVSPYDDIFRESMIQTTVDLCSEMQGCVFGYTQSDEITLVLTDYKTLSTDAYFDYRVSKINSVGASTATSSFNDAFYKMVKMKSKEWNVTIEEWYIFIETGILSKHLPEAKAKLFEKYRSRFGKAQFDCRCFNIPVDEVTNCILWRQQDAIRNSIESLAQAYFPDKVLHNKNNDEMKEMLRSQKGIDWDDMPIYLQRGTAVIKKIIDGRSKWVPDTEMPILKGEGRDYVESRIIFE